jgi:glycine cleavage system transcriptional repressor
MKEHILLSLVGTDRTGLVDRITEAVVKGRGNLESSRMAVLGGEFAMLLLVSVDAEAKSGLEANVRQAAVALDLTLTIKPTTPRRPAQGTVPLSVRVRGMDHEGIVHEVVHYLAGLGMSVEALDSQVGYAPHSGTPLFSMSMRLQAPASVSLSSLRRGLDEVGGKLNVDIDLSTASE